MATTAKSRAAATAPAAAPAPEASANLWAMLNPDPKRRADELARWTRLFDRESDRSVAISAAAMLEDKLGRIIRRAFVVPGVDANELLGAEDGGGVGVAPLAALPARAALCIALGIISKGAASQLAMFNKLRARFAHRPEGGSFESDSKAKAIVTGLRWLTDPQVPAPTTDRDRVIQAAVDLYLYLDAIEKALRPLTYWPSWYDSVFMDEQTRAREIERLMKLQKSGDAAKSRLWF